MGERLKQLREILNLKQADLARKLHTSRSYICRLENGERDISERMKKELYRVYHVNPKWLETGTGEPILKHPGEREVFVDMVYRAMMTMKDEQLKDVMKRMEELR